MPLSDKSATAANVNKFAVTFDTTSTVNSTAIMTVSLYLCVNKDKQSQLAMWLCGCQ